MPPANDSSGDLATLGFDIAVGPGVGGPAPDLRGRTHSPIMLRVLQSRFRRESSWGDGAPANAQVLLEFD